MFLASINFGRREEAFIGFCKKKREEGARF